MKKFNVAVVGATGLVGRTMIQVLEERNFPVNKLILTASERSVGKKLNFNDTEIELRELSEELFKEVDIALFSAGGEMSKEWAPKAAKQGAIVIDNSSAWRMEEGIPLVVPEVNPNTLKSHTGIIANPNCSTIQLVVALKPIKDKYGIERFVCSTYQSISGAGQKGMDKLNYELQNSDTEDEEKHPIAFNTMFHPLSQANGFTQEENKMYNEIRKIMDIPDMKFAITCVRLPILGGHAESVNLELKKDFNIEDIKPLLSQSENIEIVDDMENEEYPTPFSVAGRDEVFIGRIHRDHSTKYGLYLWVVADNLRKGAATNAVQIAEKLAEMDLV